MRLFGPVWALELDPPGVRYQGSDRQGQTLHCTVSYPGKGQPAQCEVTLFMPAREAVEALHSRTTRCRVLAGWVEDGAVELFAGTPIPGSVRDRLADEDPAVSWQLSASRSHAVVVGQTWAEVHASEVIDYLRRTMGLARGYIELPNDVLYARGHSVSGPALHELETVVTDCGAVLSIEGGELRVYPRGGAIPRVVDSWVPGSGLLDVVGPDGEGEVRAMALLRPSVRPGDTVAVTDPRWSGLLRIQSCSHEFRSDGRAATAVTGVPSA